MSFGELFEVLGVVELENLVLGFGEVWVWMLSSLINFLDVMMICGIYGCCLVLLFILGYEGVGVVEESGGGVLGVLCRNK